MSNEGECGQENENKWRNRVRRAALRNSPRGLSFLSENTIRTDLGFILASTISDTLLPLSFSFLDYGFRNGTSTDCSPGNWSE